MKRHPALANFSRDHHAALILARLLQNNAPVYKGLPADIAGKVEYAVKFYTEELIAHFKLEEEAFSLVKGFDKNLDELIMVILQEHEELHETFASIGSHPVSALQADRLGILLENHIRKEERVLFPLIQKVCTEELLQAIHNSLSHHYRK